MTTVPHADRFIEAGSRGVSFAQQWHAVLSATPPPPLELPEGRLVVVAPHPDDEVLGLGATLAARADVYSANRQRDLVVCVSDGAASHPGWLDPDEVRRRRAAEIRVGARILGVSVAELGLADGHLGTSDIDALLHPALDRTAPATVAVTWDGDGHPDHHAVALSVHRWWRNRREEVTLLEVPVWMWHWARPRDPLVPWQRLRRLTTNHHDPSAVAFAKKAAAVRAHRSQVAIPARPAIPAGPGTVLPEVILPPHVVDRFFLGAEYAFVPDGLVPAERPRYPISE